MTFIRLREVHQLVLKFQIFMQMPPGSLPRAMDVILRNEMVEQVRPGDKAIFCGSLIVIPDMAAFQAPGERTLLQAKGAPSSAPPGRGVTGIATTGARELHYKLAFLANHVQVRLCTC